MNKRSWLFSAGFLLLLFICSCNKDDSSPTIHTVTYKITSNNYQFFNNISYTDSIGVQATASAAGSTSEWTKSITEAYSNFPVQLQVVGQNSSSQNLVYTLEIIVDGISRASKPDSAAAFISFNTVVSTVVP